MRTVRKSISTSRGASALVLSGELTEGVSDLSQAMTAPGGVPALPEVNQDRSHPDSPEIVEQPHASYRQLVSSGGAQPGAGAWTTVSPPGRNVHAHHPPGPATLVAAATRTAAQAQSQQRQQSTTQENRHG